MFVIKRKKDGKYWTGHNWHSDSSAAKKIQSPIYNNTPLLIQTENGHANLARWDAEMQNDNGWEYVVNGKETYATFERVEMSPQ